MTAPLWPWRYHLTNRDTGDRAGLRGVSRFSSDGILKSPAQVRDLGCGTEWPPGQWALETERSCEGGLGRGYGDQGTRLYRTCGPGSCFWRGLQEAYNHGESCTCRCCCCRPPARPWRHVAGGGAAAALSAAACAALQCGCSATARCFRRRSPSHAQPAPGPQVPQDLAQPASPHQASSGPRGQCQPFPPPHLAKPGLRCVLVSPRAFWKYHTSPPAHVAVWPSVGLGSRMCPVERTHLPQLSGSVWPSPGLGLPICWVENHGPATSEPMAGLWTSVSTFAQPAGTSLLPPSTSVGGHGRTGSDGPVERGQTLVGLRAKT
ncbi:uncharacterized protein LOC129138005 [Pan troglodytes]|uniref:uncharacterized protein LOC129138005 n=1 Tax=Pan troglodytes TaxID=9598 RepID=UPI003013526B